MYSLEELQSDTSKAKGQTFINEPAAKLRNKYDFREREKGIYPNPSGRISLESKARLPEGENEYPIHKNAPILLKNIIHKEISSIFHSVENLSR